MTPVIPVTLDIVEVSVKLLLESCSVLLLQMLTPACPCTINNRYFFTAATSSPAPGSSPTPGGTKEPTPKPISKHIPQETGVDSINMDLDHTLSSDDEQEAARIVKHYGKGAAEIYEEGRDCVTSGEGGTGLHTGPIWYMRGYKLQGGRNNTACTSVVHYEW